VWWSCQRRAHIIVEALRAAGWNQTETARRLNVPLRTLQHKIKTFGITKIGYKVGHSKPTA
jgi:transcriptional regulator with GAF, ATPase, and Fis domain